MGQWWLGRMRRSEGVREFLLFQSGLEVGALVFPKRQYAYSLRINPEEVSLASVIRAAVLAPGLNRTDRATVFGLKKWLFEFERWPDCVWFVTAKSKEAIQQDRDRLFKTIPAPVLVEKFLDSLDRRRGSQSAPPVRLVLLEVLLNSPGPEPGAFQKLKCDAMLATLTPRQLQKYASLKRDFLHSRGDIPRGWKTKKGAFRSAQRLQHAARVRLRKYNREPQ